MRYDDAPGAGGFGGFQAVDAVFEHQHVRRRATEALGRFNINLRRRFAVNHIVGRQNELKALEKLMGLQNPPHVLCSGGSRDGHGHTVAFQLGEQIMSARQQRGGLVT